MTTAPPARPSPRSTSGLTLDHVVAVVPTLDDALAALSAAGLEGTVLPPGEAGLQLVLAYLEPPGFLEIMVPVDPDLVRERIPTGDHLLEAAAAGGGWLTWFLHLDTGGDTGGDTEERAGLDAFVHRSGAGPVREMPAAGERPRVRMALPPDRHGLLPFVATQGTARADELRRRAGLAASAAHAGEHPAVIGVELTGDEGQLREYLGADPSEVLATVRPGPPALHAVRLLLGAREVRLGPDLRPAPIDV